MTGPTSPAMASVELKDVRSTTPPRPWPRRRVALRRRGPGARPPGHERLGQDDRAQDDQPPGRARPGAVACSAATWRRTAYRPAAPHRLRHPGGRPAAAPDRRARTSRWCRGCCGGRRKSRESRARELLHAGRTRARLASRTLSRRSSRAASDSASALARALAADPPLLLMDEPFGALDPLTRRRLQDEFGALQKRLAKTVVLVTHDVPEALRLADDVAVMEEGECSSTVAPRRSRQAPASGFVARLAGGGAVLSAPMSDAPFFSRRASGGAPDPDRTAPRPGAGFDGPGGRHRASAGHR